MRPAGPATSPALALAAAWTLALILFGCGGGEGGGVALTADGPLHLEDHLDAALIRGSEPPSAPPKAVEWIFPEGISQWKPLDPPDAEVGPPAIERIDDGMRVRLAERRWTTPEGEPRLNYSGSIYVDLPDWNREDWAFVVIRGRTSDDIGSIELRFNLRNPTDTTRQGGGFRHVGEWIDIIDDGAVHSYIMRADWSYEFGEERWEGPWTQLGISIGGSREPADFDVLSVSVIPKASKYADAPAGVSNEVRGGRYHRRALYTHAPGQIEYRMRVPDAGRLDVGLGVLREDVPVRFRVRTEAGRAEPEVLLDETVADKHRWVQKSVDLAAWAGREVRIALEATAEEPGTVALWASPTVSGSRSTERPNVIFYIIDAGGADYMSAYGYNRLTTPNLELLAEEGAIFEHAYSNSSWSKTSTPSFATSLHHSVLGGYKTDTDPIPDQAVTMAERLHGAGYQTAVITSNPYAGTMSSLDRGADLLRDDGVDRNSISTVELHDDFWSWREAFPGEPYFVHFQTTDLHWPWRPVAPFAGMFIEPEKRERYHEWVRRLSEVRGLPRPRMPQPQMPEEVYQKAGVDRIALFDAARALYDECMAHQDWQLGRLVERLKVQGEWEHTLLIVAADHGNSHGLGVLDSVPEGPGPTLRSYTTRVPLVIVWPERIPAGQRFNQPVSMIDMLPTIVDLAGLPLPQVMQGRSLAPLLVGETSEAEWEPRPVVFDEFYVDWESGEPEGTLEVIDGRWGASLRIMVEEEEEEGQESGGEEETEEPSDEPVEEEAVEDESPRLRLYDLWNDPYALESVHAEHPDLVEKYTSILEGLWEAHQALAQQFSRTGEVPLTHDQIETLRTLGYIR